MITQEANEERLKKFVKIARRLGVDDEAMYSYENENFINKLMSIRVTSKIIPIKESSERRRKLILSPIAKEELYKITFYDEFLQVHSVKVTSECSLAC